MLKFVSHTVTDAQDLTWESSLGRLVLDCNAEARLYSHLTMQARYEQQLQDQFRGCEVVPERPSIISMHATLVPVTIV